MKKIVLLFLLVQGLSGQNVPFIMDHPVYPFLTRQEALGNINSEQWSTRPFTYIQINEMLAEVAGRSTDLSANDLRILYRFQQEFNRDFRDGITYPWSRSTLSGLRHPEQQSSKPFFMTYQQDNVLGWINWVETIRIQSNGQGTRGYYTDHLGIYGTTGQISFTSQFTYHRLTKNADFQDLPDSFKEGYVLERDYIDWITWDYPNSSLVYTHPDFTLGIHRQPVYWGYSADNSPILSDNVNPLPYIEWTTRVTHLRYKFMHARLSPNESPRPDTLNPRRNLSAHRVEFDLSPDFEFAFNEMIIYANRDYELAYLNPVNFLFSEEHVQGDLDNLLMAFDFKWRLRPGLMAYGTWLFDELDWYKLTSGWWGNKFVFQLGLNYHPDRNLPSFNLEYTAARPWTYSHKNPVNSYTSAGRILGLTAGPNTQTMKLQTDWQFSSRLFIQGGISWINRGDDPGSDPLNNRPTVDDHDDEDQSFLSGNTGLTRHIRIYMDYYLTRTISFQSYWVEGGIFELGVTASW